MNTHTLHTSPSQTNFAKWVMAATMTTMHDDDDNEHRKWRRGEREGCCSSVNDEHDENDNSGDDDMFSRHEHTQLIPTYSLSATGYAPTAQAV